MSSISLRHIMHRVWPVAALTVLIVYFFQDALASLLHTWRSYEGYEHGLLVSGIWLAGLAMITPREGQIDAWLSNKCLIAVGIVILALLSFFNEIGAAFDIEIIQYATIFAFAVAGAVLLTRPESYFRYIVLAIFLATGIPFWGFVLGVLQATTIQVAETLLRFLAVPVLFSGDIVDLPYGRFRIDEGCGGLRYFLSALAFSSFYVFLFIDDKLRGTVFVLVTCMLALVANWVRVAGIIWVGYVSEMQSDLVQDHYMFGWLVFAAFLIPVHWIGYKLQPAMGEARNHHVAPVT